jgi:hypothetical protein
MSLHPKLSVDWTQLSSAGLVLFGRVETGLKLLGIDLAALISDAACLAEDADALRIFGQFLDLFAPDNELAVGLDKLYRTAELGHGLFEDGVAWRGAIRIYKKANDGENSGNDHADHEILKRATTFLSAHRGCAALYGGGVVMFLARRSGVGGSDWRPTDATEAGRGIGDVAATMCANDSHWIVTFPDDLLAQSALFASVATTPN